MKKMMYSVIEAIMFS